MKNFYDNLDLEKYTTGSFHDSAKAYDSLERSILFNKLEHYGVPHNALNEFKSYFSARLQYVEYNKFKYFLTSVEFGDPQGNFVGQIIFKNVINDLTKCVPDAKFFFFRCHRGFLSLIFLYQN